MVSQLESLTEMISALSIIKITCKRLVEINEYNSEVLLEIIDKIESISIYNLLNTEDRHIQIDSIIQLAYNIGIIVTL